MAAKSFETIIIGAGISGLSCAKHLQQNNQDFLLISKDIGGRILTSADGKVNYGAFFVCSDYYHLLKYVRLKSRIKLSDFCFHENDEIYFLYRPSLIAYSIQFLKILRVLYKFRKRFRKFRIDTEKISQKKAIENDSFLNEIYMKNAVDFVKENKLESGTKRYLSKGLYSTTFSNISDMNAFSYLQFLIPLITPIYRFEFLKDKMIEPFKEKISIDCATDIKYDKGMYKIKTNKKTYHSKNLVFATEIGWSKKYAGVKNVNKPVSTHMLHVNGKPKDIISRKKYQVFPHPSEVQAVADLSDGTYLFYYKNHQPKLENYFSKPKIIASHYWDQVGTINGHHLIESNRGKNMYLIGDYNVAGLEEAYITGIFSANQIIKSNQS